MDGGPAPTQGPTPAGPDRWPPADRWPDALHRALRALTIATRGRTRPLVALSGGVDSLALAVTAAVAVGTRTAPEWADGAGAVVVDHGLHADSAAVAGRAADVARGLGLDPAVVVRVEVTPAGEGPEAEARTARHAGLEAAAREHGSDAVLLAHTRDDQAEQVLLGLARGSGTRSLAGIPRRRGLLLRPLLDLTRRDMEEICRWAGVRWWQDPSNADPAYLRSRIRTRLLPMLEDPHDGLGPGLSAALARSADIAAEDAAALEQWAAAEFERLRGLAGGAYASDEAVGQPAGSLTDPLPGTPTAPPNTALVVLPLGDVAVLPDAVRHRVIAAAALSAGGGRPSRERVLAVDGLVATRATGGTSAGPVELPGGVVVHRRRADGCATLVFSAGGPPHPTRTGSGTDAIP